MKSKLNIRKFLSGMIVASRIFIMVDITMGGSVAIASGFALWILGILTAGGVSYFISLCNRFEY